MEWGPCHRKHGNFKGHWRVLVMPLSPTLAAVRFIPSLNLFSDSKAVLRMDIWFLHVISCDIISTITDSTKDTCPLNL